MKVFLLFALVALVSANHVEFTQSRNKTGFDVVSTHADDAHDTNFGEIEYLSFMQPPKFSSVLDRKK
jgi:hypothetical protein